MDAGHDINKLDASQETPLHDAISSGECLEFCSMSVHISPTSLHATDVPRLPTSKPILQGA